MASRQDALGQSGSASLLANRNEQWGQQNSIALALVAGIGRSREWAVAFESGLRSWALCITQSHRQPRQMAQPHPASLPQSDACLWGHALSAAPTAPCGLLLAGRCCAGWGQPHLDLAQLQALLGCHGGAQQLVARGLKGADALDLRAAQRRSTRVGRTAVGSSVRVWQAASLAGWRLLWRWCGGGSRGGAHLWLDADLVEDAAEELAWREGRGASRQPSMRPLARSALPMSRAHHTDSAWRPSSKTGHSRKAHVTQLSVIVGMSAARRRTPHLP